jgi:hypothetical protein
MNLPENTGPPIGRPQPETKRPLLLSVLCLFSFVFFGILSLVFLVSFFYSKWITGITNSYLPEAGQLRWGVIGITAAGFLLHAAAFTGSVQMWRMKRSGFYVFGIACLVISVYQIFRDEISIGITLLYIGLILLFGIFFKKLR